MMWVETPVVKGDYRKRPEVKLLMVRGARHVIDNRGRGCVGRLIKKQRR